MWLNNYEEATYGPFSDYIDKNEGKLFLFELNDGAIVIVKDFSGDFESDNGLDSKEDGYEEYWERAFEIVEIIKDDSNKYKVGQKFCINYHCVPNSYKVN